VTYYAKKVTERGGTKVPVKKRDAALEQEVRAAGSNSGIFKCFRRIRN